MAGDAGGLLDAGLLDAGELDAGELDVRGMASGAGARWNGGGCASSQWPWRRHCSSARLRPVPTKASGPTSFARVASRPAASPPSSSTRPPAPWCWWWV